MSEIKTKVCKICSEKKPVEEFRCQRNICLVCNHIQNKNIIVSEGWTLNEYKTIIDLVLNSKIYYLNELENILHRQFTSIINIFDSLQFHGGNNFKLRILVKCKQCNTDVVVNVPRYKKYINGEQDIFCNLECKNTYRTKRILTTCEYCNKEISVVPSKLKANKHIFCSCECSIKFREIDCIETRECEWCHQNFSIKHHKPNRFCSEKCQKESYTYNFSGENHWAYSQISINCDWCGKEFTRNPARIQNQNNSFCSVECRQEYFKNVTIQTPEWKEQNRQVALKNLENGVYKTDSDIQIIVNELLDKINIKYINEYILGNYSVDNYLKDYNLIIEVNGGYWHCDPRVYKNINYEVQLNRIRSDKAKHTYIKKYRNIEILYLWEQDIQNNIELCEKLIRNYVTNNGILKNYHSFNYENDMLLSQKVIKPYSQWSKEKLNMIIDLSIKERPEYYVSFNCELCGKESSQLISKYNDSEHHFCSRECSDKHLKIEKDKQRIYFNCDYCGKETSQIISQSSKKKNHFCSKECYDQFQKTSIIKKCDNCGKDHEVPLRKQNKNKHFFCSQKCDKEFKSKNKVIRSDYITFQCEQCGEKVTRRLKEYNTRKNHFCSPDCANEYLHNQSLIKYNCDWCGKEVIKNKCKYNPNSSYHVCSKSCGNKMRHKLNKYNK